MLYNKSRLNVENCIYLMMNVLFLYIYPRNIMIIAIINVCFYRFMYHNSINIMRVFYGIRLLCRTVSNSQQCA